MSPLNSNSFFSFFGLLFQLFSINQNNINNKSTIKVHKVFKIMFSFSFVQSMHSQFFRKVFVFSLFIFYAAFNSVEVSFLFFFLSFIIAHSLSFLTLYLNIIKKDSWTSMNERAHFFIKIYLSHIIHERIDVSVVCKRWRDI